MPTPHGPSLRCGTPWLAVAWIVAITGFVVARPAPAALDVEAPILSGIEIRTDEPLARRLDLERLLAFQPGERLTQAAVRRTLSNAHASGLFAEVEVLTRHDASEPAGVMAILVLRGYLRLARVEVEVAGAGAGGEGRRTRRNLRLREGQILEEVSLQSALQAMRDAWQKRGYREVELAVELLPTDAHHRVDLRVTVTPGERPRVAEVRFDLAAEDAPPGERRAAAAALARVKLPAELGAPWRPDRLADAPKRLRRALVDLGYLAAEVASAPAEFPRRGEVVVVFAVQLGPRVELEIVGAERSKLRRQGFLPFLDDRPFHEDLLRSQADALRRHFQERGHRRARTQVERLPCPAATRQQCWRLTVEPGEPWLLRRLEFVGNDSRSSDELRRLMVTRERRRLEAGSGRLVDEQLTQDVETLRSYYLLAGYSQVRVGPAEIVSVASPTDSEPGVLELRIPIEEGPRQRVVDLEIHGLRSLASTEVVRRLPLRAGGPFHPLLLDDAIEVLRTLYEDAGYRATTITPRLDWNDERTLVDVALAVDEGPQTLIDRLVLRGLVHTRPEVVRDFAGLVPGEPLNRRGLLRAERDLYRLGVFSRVEVQPSPSGPTPASDGVRRRDVILALQEGSAWRVSYGLSFHSDDGIGGLFGLTRSHIAGRAARLQLDLRASENDRRARLVFDDPSLLRRRLPLTWSLFVRDEERPSFSVAEAGAQLALIRDTGPLRWGLVWDFRQVHINGRPEDLASLERQDQEVEITSLTPNLFYDRRDDPLNPQLGGSTALQLEWAFPALGAEASFAKAFMQQTWHHNLGRAGVLAWSARAGAIEPFASDLPDDPFLDPDLASARIPVSERFFAGGRTSHRAYERDALGLLGQSLTPLADGRILQQGGNGLLLLNLDYRFPIAGSFGGVAWADVGNVWADWRDLDADDLRPGAGLGLRYLSPIGPVRLEIGWKLDRQPFETADPVFFLSFGNPF